MAGDSKRTVLRKVARAGLGAALVWVCQVGWGQPEVSGQSSESAGTTTRPVQAETWLRVTADVADVRSRPDANSVVVARLARGAILKAVDRDAYGWYRVFPPEGVFSFVAAQYIDRRGPAEGVVSVRSGGLRVRVGSLVHELDPRQSEVQTLLQRGASVQIVGQQGEWLKIVPPSGVYVYVFADQVEPISPEVAAGLRSESALTSQPPVVTKPASMDRLAGPDLSGPWGQRLASVEADIEVEADKLLPEQSWSELISRLRPIADQREEPMVARLAQAWIDQLERRTIEQEVARDAEEVLRRLARDQARHEREMARIQRAREVATSPAFQARGQLLRSYALQAEDGRWYRLLDPLTQRVETYVEVQPGSRIEPEKLLGQYVGVRGNRRFEPKLGADVVLAEQIVVLEAGIVASQPATRQAP